MSSSKPVVLVTGSNGGLGRGIVKDLIENEVGTVACHYRSSSSEISSVLKGFDLDPDRQLFQADLTSEEDIHNMRLQIEEQLGPVTGVLNLAGGSTNGMSWKLSKKEFLEVVDQNLMTTFLCNKEFIPGMRSREEGSIINISSVVGATGVVGASHYCAAKAGINGLTKAVALELASKKIRVNALALGYFNAGLIDDVPTEIQTDIKSHIPLKRFGSPAEIAALVRYLLQPGSEYTTGQIFHINGGLF